MNHVRDYSGNTIVMQASGQITFVKTPPANLITIGDRIAWARSQRGLTQAQLAAAAGVSQGTIANAESGIRGKPRQLLAIAHALNVSIDWLERGQGPWERDHANLEAMDRQDSVPVISWVQAGQWSDIVDNFQPGDADDWLPCPVRHGPRTYCLIVRGFSMHNPGSDLSFKDGDRIFVDPDREAQHKSLVIVRLEDEAEATFKQLLIEGEQRMLQALNPQWPDRIMKINGRATLCGVVIGRVDMFI